MEKNIYRYLLILFLISGLFFYFSPTKAEITMTGEPTIVDKKEYSGSILLRYVSACTPNADYKMEELTKNTSNPLPEEWCNRYTKSGDFVTITTVGGKKTCVGKMGTYLKLNPTTKKYESTSINKGYALFYGMYKDRTNNIFTERAIIYPKNLKTASRIYIHWHGRGWESYNIIKECQEKSAFCKLSTEMNDSVIIWPRTFNIGSSVQTLTTDEVKCLLDESIKILSKENVDTSKAGIILTGHSAGGNWITKSLKNISWASGKKLITGIFFDATYGWESVLFGSGYYQAPLFVYHNVNSSGKSIDVEGPYAEALKEKKTDMVKILGLINGTHQDVLTYCFMDHLTGTGCIGPGSLATAPFINNFKNIADAPGGNDSYMGPPNSYSGSSSGGSSASIPIKINKISEIVNSPNLQIKIPGLDFTGGVEIAVESDGTYVYTSFFQQYIVAVYRYSVVAISIITVVMIMVAGLQWLTSGGSPDKIKLAQKRIAQSIIGIIIAVGSYTVLFTINPYLVGFNSLKTQYFQDPGEEDESKYYYYDGNSGPSIANLTSINTTDQIFPLTQNSLKEIRNNFGKKRCSPNEVDCQKLRCHVGNDLYTKPPGQVVAIDEGEVVRYHENFILTKGGCSGVSIWETEAVELQAGKVGYIMIYHKNLNITVMYGEINTEDIQKLKKKFPIGSTIPKGQYLGIASRCGMLHLEVYQGKVNINQRWLPDLPPSNSTDNHLCVTINAPNRPPTLMNAEDLTEKIKSNVVADLVSPSI